MLLEAAAPGLRSGEPGNSVYLFNGASAARVEHNVIVSVWSMLEECVSQLDEPFRRSEIMGWFRRHYPDAKETTVAAHIYAATANAVNRAVIVEAVDQRLDVAPGPIMDAAPSTRPRRCDSRLRGGRSRRDETRVRVGVGGTDIKTMINVWRYGFLTLVRVRAVDN